MAGWSGFSDEDLRKMRLSNSTENNIPARKTGRPASTQKSRHNKPAGQSSPPVPQREEKEKVTPHKENSLEEKASTTDNKLNINPGTPVYSSLNPFSESSEVSSHVKAMEAPLKPDKTQGDIKELNETEALNMELSNVQKFQQQQKVIEEANKHKRALLAQAIENRRKKAKAEAEKLMRVQQELNHLDTLLTADVSIIRDRIEVASLEYNEAQKRYEKAEKEFVAAKMDLFAKGDVKEQLTEHLYTIIHQNEIRKAKKLVELMEKLAMEVSPEEWELTIPAIPQLTNFTAVATLHDPHHNNSMSRLKGADEPSIEKVHEPDRLALINVSASKVQSSEVGATVESQNCSENRAGAEVIPCVPIVQQFEHIGQTTSAASDLPHLVQVQDINENFPGPKNCEGTSDQVTVTHNASSEVLDYATGTLGENIEVDTASTSASTLNVSNGWKHPFS